MRAVTAAAAAVATALGLALASLLPHGAHALRLGRAGDAHALSSFLPPSEHLGARGRWTRGEGVVQLPASPIAAIVSLRLAPPDGRAPDAIEIVVNGVHTHRRMLAAGWNDVDVPVNPRFAAGAITLRLRSAVTASDASTAPRGLFVERVTLHTGGMGLLRATPVATVLWLALAWLGTIAFVWLLVRRPIPIDGVDLVEERPGRAARALTAGAILLLAFAAIVVFRTPLLSHVAALTSLSWGIALVAALATSVVPAAMRRSHDRNSETRATSDGATSDGATGDGATGDGGIDDGTSRHGAAWDRAPLLFAASALVLIALLFPDAIRRGHVLSQADMFYEFQPWRTHAPQEYRAPDRAPLGDVPMLVYPFTTFARARLREGLFPLWTSAISAGQPFLATYQSALLSPFTLVAVFVPLPQATVAIAALRLLVGGLGMFLFLRAIGVSRLASAFGGITFLLNPFTIVWIEHPLAGVPPWLPWMLLAGERLATRVSAAAQAQRTAPGSPHGSRWGSPWKAHGRWPWSAVAGLAIATALTLAGGHPHTGMFVALLGGSYALACALATGRGRWLQATGLAGVGLALGLALVALQVLPFLEYVSLSRAAAARADYPLNPFIAPASTLIAAIVPNFLGHHGDGNFAGPTNYLEQLIYPGIATWLLAAVGLIAGVRRWRAWFFAIAGLLAMLVMYGAPGVHQIVSSLPLIKVASLPRAAIVAIGALTVLAALGADDVLRTRVLSARPRRDASPRPAHRPEPGNVSSPDSRWPATIALALAASATVAIALVTLRTRAAWLDAHGLLDFTTRWTSLAIWLTVVVTTIALARLWGVAGRIAAGLALAGLAALDLLLVGRGFHPLIPPDQVFPRVPEIQRVQEDRELFRVLGAGGALMPNAAMVYGLQDVRGYDGLLVARYADLLDAVFRYDHHTHLAVNLQSPLIDLLNVKYVFGLPQIAAPEGWFTPLIGGDAPLYRNNRVFPRAFLVDGIVVQDGNAARRTLRDGRVDFHRVALVEQDLSQETRPVAAATTHSVGSATITSYGDHRVEVQTDAPDRRLLILMDVHYPGWVATIDGQPAPIIRANFAFRAVSVPGGRHAVTFAYRPASFRIGLAISGAAAFVLVGLAIAGRRRTPAEPGA